MLAILLISIIANGFIILRFSPRQFYKLHRYEGQLLYIKATSLGLIAFGVSFLLDSYLEIVGYLYKLLPKSTIATIFETEHLQECLIFFAFSAFLSALYCVLQRLWLFFEAQWLLRGSKNKLAYNELSKVLLMHTILNDSPLDKLLLRSYVQNIFLLITMSDRKVYVGRVISLGEPNEKQGPDQEISIVPVFSGYRDKDTLSVTLENSYANKGDTKDFYLILKQDSITSACEFVETLYENFSKRNHETV